MRRFSTEEIFQGAENHRSSDRDKGEVFRTNNVYEFMKLLKIQLAMSLVIAAACIKMY